MTTLDGALAQLTRTGSVTLRGETSVRARLAGVGITVLQVLTVLAAVASLVFIVAVIARGVAVNPVAFALPLGLAALMFVYPRLRRTQRRVAAAHAAPIVLSPQGFTIRGVGPIPWRDALPPSNQLVPLQHDSGYELRAVMPLTPAGMRGINSLPPETRRLLGPQERRLGGGGPVHHLYVPSSADLSLGEMMQLLGAANRMFTGMPRG